jgi:citrate lyase subunit gamma (acyl carrier protein)
MTQTYDIKFNEPNPGNIFSVFDRIAKYHSSIEFKVLFLYINQQFLCNALQRLIDIINKFLLFNLLYMATMKPLIAAQSGTFESSDVIFLIEPLADQSGRRIELSSTVMHQYGTSFRQIVDEMLNHYDLTDIHLIAKDKGALEPTIKARLETAIKRSLGQQEGTLS